LHLQKIEQKKIIFCFFIWVIDSFLHFCKNFLSSKKYVIMGRGDKKTKKGKIFKGSFGKSRPAKKNKPKNEEKKEEKKEEQQ